LRCEAERGGAVRRFEAFDRFAMRTGIRMPKLSIFIRIATMGFDHRWPVMVVGVPQSRWLDHDRRQRNAAPGVLS
jgi:hypothetical protein